MKATIKCNACQGSGHVPVPRELQQAIDALKLAVWIPSREVGQRIAMRTGTISSAALANRLARLLELKFVERREAETGTGYEWRLRSEESE